MKAWMALAALAMAPGLAQGFDLQGHRGARGLYPENTLPAFAAALGIGVTTLELDTGITRDGQVVVGHDPELNPNIVRTPDGKFLDATGPAIARLDWAELRRYDVGRIKPGTRYAQTFAQQQPVDGTRMPLLSEVFALAAKAANAEVRFNIETKLDPRKPDATLPPAAFAERLVVEIRRAGVAARSTVQSFDWRTLQVVQQIAPEIATVYLTAQQSWLDNVQLGQPGPSAWTAGFDVDDHGGSVPRLVKAAGGRIWSPFFGDLTAEKLAEAKALGLAVIVWTVNTPEDIERMIALGVDGVITDYPDRLRAALVKRGAANLPKPTPVVP